MKKVTVSPFVVLLSVAALSGCSSLPKMTWGLDEGTGPAYAQDGGQAGAAGKPQAPLDVPPELQADLQMPAEKQVASKADTQQGLPERYAESVAGKDVALDAKMYDFTPAQVFSATVDAMTSLNLPLGSVDSPSGILTTDWIRAGANNPGILAGLFGGSGHMPTRHRFVVRVFRATTVDGVEKTRLEVRVLAQSFESSHWVNKPVKAKVTNELFDAVNEQLTRMQNQPAQPVAPNATPADTPSGLPAY